MRRTFSALLGASLMLPLLPAQGAAQEMPEQGQLGLVMHVEVAPKHRQAYREAVEKLVEAAGAAGITDYSWHFWGNDTGFILYYPIDSFGYFDDEMQLWRSFEGTEGQAGRDEFFGAMQGIPHHTRTEVVESLPGLEYWPEGYDDVQVGHFHFESVADMAGYEAWMDLAKDFVAFLGKIKYPYGARAYRTRIGDDRMIWVFFAPGLSEFHSDAAWDDLIEAAGAEADMKALDDRFRDIIAHWEHADASHIGSMSYVPEEM